MSRQEIADKLKDILISQNPQDRDLILAGTEESSLSEYYGLQSIGMLYMIIVIESEFAVSFDGTGMNDFTTLGDVVTFILDQLNGK